MYQLWISLIVAIVMAGGLYGIFYLIVKQNATLGVKAIQLSTIVVIVPSLIILGINSVLHAETIGTILGVITGFVLSGSWKEL